VCQRVVSNVGVVGSAGVFGGRGLGALTKRKLS
jgi:hypothetical protein